MSRSLKYRVLVLRVPEDEEEQDFSDAVYEGTFDANEQMADEIGEQAGSAIEEGIQCDVAARMQS